MNTSTSLIDNLVERLDPDLRYLYEERAGIMEFDAATPRAQAGCLALVNVLAAHPEAVSGITLVRVDINGTSEFLLTTDIELARQRFEGSGATVTRVANPAEFVERDLGGMALLGRIA